MSYLVLARKWRPQTFEEVVGQAHVTRTLRNAIRAGRVAHAYLFTGARGVGKTSVARILAKSLNCEPALSVSPCNVCSNCREITQGHSVDVPEIDGASNRGIDSIRELRETVRYRPSKSRHKIYIIDEVHMLTTEAFNALLKTLEEPPDHVRFILATTEPHKIPATILSRCQRFDFRRIDTPRLLDHLKTIVTGEQVDLSEPVLYAIAREADGSMRDAQSLLEQLLAFSGDGLSDEEILDVLGVVDRRSVHRAGAAVLEGDALTCLQVVDDIYRRGIDSRRFCQQLCDFFRNLLWLAVSREKADAVLDLPETEKEFLNERLGGTSAESLYLCLQCLVKGEEEIRRSSSPRLNLEMVLLRLSQLPRLEDMNRVVDELERLEQVLSGMPDQPRPGGDPIRSVEAPGTRVERRESDPAVRPRFADEAEAGFNRSHGAGPGGEDLGLRPPASPEDMVSRWPVFVQWLHGKDPRLAAKLGRSSLKSVSESTAELEILEIYENLFQNGENTAALAAHAAGYFGVSLEWRISTKSSVRGEKSERAVKKGASGANPRRVVMESRAVQQAIEILGGELIEVRPLDRGAPSRGKGRGSKPSE
ncbi:MAG: DNA polymerase III subunit gamma/tau [Syntrophobacteraceae bacterium]|jgi:DNA polymerase-3 subunit gamma/tau|nr:DNA polymerase III subunit gamma/tau [Syntrophobacteraceae bacterium]